MSKSKSKYRRVHRCTCLTCQQHPSSQIAVQHKAINRVLANLDEKNRRRFVGLLALQSGHRQITLLRQITGLSRTTIYRGQRELEQAEAGTRGRLRASGGGRQLIEKNIPI